MQQIASAGAPAVDAVPAIRAVVQAGATETHYRRAGRGATVLLLFPGGADDPPAATLFDRLARRFRVIAPLPPAAVRAASAGRGAAPMADWLRDLIDGLGLARPVVVVEASLAAAALAFAQADSDRVGALVAVSGDPTTALTPRDRSDGLHVVRIDGGTDDVDEVIRFIDQEMAIPLP